MTNQFIMTTESEDRIGIVAALTTCLAAHDGFINELAQFGAPGHKRFFSRICFSMDEGHMPAFRSALSEVCDRLSLKTTLIPQAEKIRMLLMVSKTDHCLNDILYRYETGMLHADIPAIVSNHETLRDKAEAAGIPFFYVPVTPDTKPAAEQKLRDIIADTQTDLIVLARYMQVLSSKMCADFPGQIINIHHSFLPSFKGARPYQRAYERGVKLIGATAHYVTEDLDEGPIIEQSVERVDHHMSVDDLITIGRDVEAKTLARAIKLHTEHRVFINGIKTVIL